MKHLYSSFLCLFCLLTASAQSGLSADYFWLGTGYANNTLGGRSMYISFFAELSPQHTLGVSFSVNDEELDGPFIKRHPDIYIHNLSLWYGKRWKEFYGYIGLYSGLSLLSGKERGTLDRTVDSRANTIYRLYNVDEYVTVGLPVKAEIMVTPIKWVGLGFSAMGNLNFKRPYATFMLTASFGLVNSEGGLWQSK